MVVAERARSIARSLAAGRGEETQARSRDEEKDSALRPRAAEVWNDREVQKKQKEKRRRKREIPERIGTRRESSERRYANV